jgi:hypothetical protein
VGSAGRAAVATSVQPLAARSIERSLKVAMPASAAAESVPERVALPSLLVHAPPSASVTVAALVVIRFPDASLIATCTGGAINAPITTPLGCTVNASAAGALVVTSKAGLVAEASPLDAAASAYPWPACAMFRSGKLATPLLAATESVPASCPLPPSAAIDSAIVGPASATRLPKESSTASCTGGAIVAPACAFEGGTVKASFAAGPATNFTVTVWVNGVPPTAAALTVLLPATVEESRAVVLPAASVTAAVVITAPAPCAVKTSCTPESGAPSAFTTVAVMVA